MSLTVTRLLQRPFARSFATASTCHEQKKTLLPYIPRKKRTPKVDPQSESLLPPSKLRALVSLYHQCDDIITEDNLLKQIDAAFLDEEGKARRHHSFSQIEFKRFREVVNNQREAPRISPWSHETVTPTRPEDQWSGGLPTRERQIIDALYGVESVSLPGYETLVDAKKKV